LADTLQVTSSSLALASSSFFSDHDDADCERSAIDHRIADAALGTV
jgi:hypothetical protein